MQDDIQVCLISKYERDRLTANTEDKLLQYIKGNNAKNGHKIYNNP